MAATAALKMTNDEHFDLSATTKLALIAGLLAGLGAYLVNGHDFVRTIMFAPITLASAWYGGKVIFSKPADGVDLEKSHEP